MGFVGAYKKLILLSEEITQDILKSYEINIGLAISSKENKTPFDLLKNAKTAAQLAVKTKKGTYQFFHSDHQDSIFRSLQLETDIAFAIAKNELYLQYQPQISLKEKKIVGAEALLRWKHTTLGEINPTEFMRIVEKSDYIFDIGFWILETALSEFKKWETPSTFQISINVAPKQLSCRSFVENIFLLIKKYNLNPTTIAIELIENEMILDISDYYEKLDLISKSGIQILIDDFGTGYASFNYLKTLPVNGVKIDKSFIKDLPTNKVDQLIVKASIEIAHALKLKVIAEGVENQAQILALEKLYCDEAQGYFFSKPMSSEKLIALLKQ
ncbi:MAG: hypothetical protein COY58_04630 [Gammaproteobacteria bacterium CG_4_10_14_0_8_um_filter_38_16]|nr:MAG: hypothetical protein COY58_04630 [Gammaproteobacteria bacterium CG_4_10_14_0_8_um_filter_38_16]